MAKENQTPMEYETLKLNTKAVTEAVLRLPHTMLAFYLRSLRLEERFAQAKAGIQSIQSHLKILSQKNPSEYLQAQMSWLDVEFDKLNRTVAGINKGDLSFRNTNYQLAIEQYAACLVIDGEGSQSSKKDVSNAGGRLHAVLHYNRARSFTQLQNFKLPFWSVRQLCEFTLIT